MGISYHWESIPFKSIECGPVKTVQLDDLPNDEMIAEELQVDLDCEVDVTSWISCFGTEYCPGLLVCSNRGGFASILLFNALIQIVSCQYEVDTMSCAGDNRFYIPSIKFPGDKVWYYLEDIKEIIPEPLPATSSTRHFSVLLEIWAKYRKKII